ncbi:hypothetical protein EDD11_002321 [Mortierella claussenii]|nr:hypothetical protein EDD11_002321 [Mortierella claussenii]
MSRILCPQSAQWIAATLRAGGLCRNSQHSNVLARNRISICKADHTYQCLFSTSHRVPAKKRSTLSTDPATLDNISKTLINDLYTRPSSAKKVTLEDVLALRPTNRNISIDDFNKLKDLVAASFNVTQLRGVLRSQSMPSGGKKSVLINQIMILLDLEVAAPKSKPPVVEDPYIDEELRFVQESFPSNRRELFFILGSEGDSLRQLEKEKRVRISINMTNETYMIRGAQESIQEARERIQEMVAVTEESWDISAYKNRDVVMKDPTALEDIARRSETFVSAGDNHTLAIAGRSSKDIEEAKRLFDLKMHESAGNIEHLTFLHQEDELKPVGMFPVFDSVAMSLDESQKSYFRICQAEPYADTTTNNPTFHPVQSSPSNIGSLNDLGKHLQNVVKEIHQPQQAFDLSARFGQVLFQNNNQNMTQLPIPTSFDTLELEEWLQGAENPYFYESLPFAKAVAKLPLVLPKMKTIEAQYTPSSKVLQTLGAHGSTSPSPLRIIFQLNNEGELYIHDGRTIDRQIVVNFMMLGQPTDVQIRSEISTKIDVQSTALRDLMSKTNLQFANALVCPRFFAFNDMLSTPIAAQLGLQGTSTLTHTLRSVYFRTTGVFDYHGLPLVASDIIDQYGNVRKQDLKLLPVPLDSLSLPIDGDTLLTPSSTASSPFEHWDEFIRATQHLNLSI